MLVFLGVLLIIEILIFAILLVRNRRKSEVRKLVGITLDTAVVQREFTVGDKFNCDGLVVQAAYNLDPTSDNIVDFVVLTEEKLEAAKSNGALNGCYVVKPAMNEVGKKNITVVYQNQTAVYSIAINERVARRTLDTESVSASQAAFVFKENDANKLFYNRSFKARLIQSNDKVKKWYTKLKNELLSAERRCACTFR